MIGRYIAFIIGGLIAGLLYYHHIWIEIQGLGQGKGNPVFTFWFRFAALALLLTAIFNLLPGGTPAFVIGLFIARPLYFYMNRERVFRGKDAG
ncbi:MAG TPA: hypothetical protein ENK09_08245 [Nitrospirae bacterium]|nr:hypothetical protein [Nitrospirota bacterium]